MSVFDTQFCGTRPWRTLLSPSSPQSSVGFFFGMKGWYDNFRVRVRVMVRVDHPYHAVAALGACTFLILFLSRCGLISIGWEVNPRKIQGILPFQSVAALGAYTYPILALIPFGFILFEWRIWFEKQSEGSTPSRP